MGGLPGDVTAVSQRIQKTCEKEGCSAPAIHRLQGETDSFGAEYSYWCGPHLLEHEDQEAALFEAGQHWTQKMTCAWCKKHSVECHPRRDMDEGAYGPVYYVCGECNARQRALEREELAEMEREDARLREELEELA